MNIALWIVQVAVAILFASGGIMKVFLYDQARNSWPWVKDRSRSFLIFVGFVDLLAAAGLLVPQLTGIAEWLAPLAAVGGAVVLALAAALHLKRQEKKDALMNLIFMVLSIVVAIGRF